MNKFKISLIIVLITQTIFSQVKDENIGTEVINVVKPYTPTISDAFKVKEIPSFDDDETSKKEEIKYNIFSFPVASTFTPSKGKAAGVDKAELEKYFNNYLTLGAGNFGTINAELFVAHSISNTDYVAGLLRHQSSQGGIKDVLLEDKFFNTSIDLTYGSKSQNLSWNADLDYQNQKYNWYGINASLFLPTEINAIDEQQSYNTIYAGGRLKFNESILKEASLKFTHFSDAFSSSENRFLAKPNLEFDVISEKIKANFVFDFVSGSFNKDYSNLNQIKYGFTNLGFSPTFTISSDEYSLNLGASFFYSVANQGGSNKFFIYPNITASFNIVNDLMIAYAGAEGTLQQNTYHDFVQENFFVSPTLAIVPTDRKYDIFGGLKGKLSNAVAYNIRASVKNENNKALYKINVIDYDDTNKKGYAFGNSFDIKYDNLKTLSFYGELKADFSKNVSFGVNGTFSSYATDVEQEAWNLPNIELSSTIDFKITSKWFAGAKVFFVGERKDQQVLQSSLIDFAPFQIITLDSYIDLNAHIDYKHSKRLSFFLKGNNLAGQDYQKWLNFPVQSIQVLLGANYKFDF